MSSGKIAFIYTTFPSQIKAQEVSKTLLEEHLIACVNMFPQMQSSYWWKDQIQTETEVAALFKTSAINLKRLHQRLEKLHPYECPCLAVLAPQQVNAAFENWILDSVSMVEQNKK